MNQSAFVFMVPGITGGFDRLNADWNALKILFCSAYRFVIWKIKAPRRQGRFWETNFRIFDALGLSKASQKCCAPSTVPKKIKLQNELKILKILDTFSSWFSKIFIWSLEMGKKWKLKNSFIFLTESKKTSNENNFFYLILFSTTASMCFR